MRIRKHAKISQLADKASPLLDGALLQTYVCQLNQSPWDAMRFSDSPPSSPLPPPLQVDAADASDGNGGSDRRVLVAESNGNVNVFVGDDKEAAKEQCCKTEGKSWRCRREDAAGSSLCDHRLSLVKKDQNLAHNSSKKSEKTRVELEVENRRSTRWRTTDCSSIPGWTHEFYYYSGFRPGWSKKTSQASIRKMDSNDDDQEDEGSVARKMKRARRKPVKARSLKSLM